jgi:hypothetical protein
VVREDGIRGYQCGIPNHQQLTLPQSTSSFADSNAAFAYANAALENRPQLPSLHAHAGEYGSNRLSSR